MVAYGRWSLMGGGRLRFVVAHGSRFDCITFVACFSQELSWILHNTMAGTFDRTLLVIWSMLHDVGIQFPYVAHLRIHVSGYPPNLGYSLEVTGYSAVKPWWPLWVIKETGILLQQRETDEASWYCKLLIISPPPLPTYEPLPPHLKVHLLLNKKNIRLCKPPI